MGYGYSFERRRFDFLLQVPTLPVPIPVEVRANIGRLLGSVVVDKRDDVINTRQGPFHSSSAEWGPTELGSTRPFRKYLGQQFYFVPWKKVTFASAARLEVAGGPGRGLITTERLRVGGANTVRGYEDDTLALRGVGQNTEGSTSIVVLNEEIRFPLSAGSRASGSGTTPTSTARRATSPACGCATVLAQGFGCCCPSSSCAWTTATRSTRTSSTTRAGGISR